MISAGRRFGLLVTLSDAGRASDGHRLWLCACDCGNKAVKATNVLRASGLRHCGCMTTAIMRQCATTHGMRRTPTYSSWQAAKRRCHNPDDKDFHRYGARGIRMCGEWLDSFERFLADMGVRPAGTTLDRCPNVDGNYEPGNCRWATATAQARNRRASIWLQWRGSATHLSDVAAKLGITYGAAFMRLKRGQLHDLS